MKRMMRVPGLRRLRKWLAPAENRSTPTPSAKPVSSVDQQIAEWERNGRPAPPPHAVKQQALKKHADEHGIRILVETGTFYGEMVAAMKDHFDLVYSIELSEDLHAKARRKFKDASNVRLIQGDSAVELGKLMASLDQPAVFWLDGHYSAGVTARGEKDTPIFEELAHILGAPDIGHVIVIDDARLFGTDPEYPSVEQLADFVRATRPDVGITVQDDSIRITPGHERA